MVPGRPAAMNDCGAERDAYRTCQSIQDDSVVRRPKKFKQCGRRCYTKRGCHVVPGPDSGDVTMAPWWRTSARSAFSSGNAGTFLRDIFHRMVSQPGTRVDCKQRIEVKVTDVGFGARSSELVSSTRGEQMQDARCRESGACCDQFRWAVTL